MINSNSVDFFSKINLILFFLVLSNFCVLGQRYKDRIFSNVTVIRDLTYTSEILTNTNPKYFLLDIYQPAEDTVSNRPVIIWIHGGGFRFGNKKSRGIPLWSRRFAERGYVSVAVNYRLQKKASLTDRNAVMNGCMMAMEDIRKVIAYLKKERNIYKIDTSKIILAGNSAGAMVSLQSVYSNPVLMGSKDSLSLRNNICNPDNIVAVVNFWGALFDSSWLNNARVPIVSVHGKRDRVVPAQSFAKGLFGSIIIHRYANSLRIPNALRIFENKGHELQRHFNPIWAGFAAHKRWREAGDFAAQFLYSNLYLSKKISTL